MSNVLSREKNQQKIELDLFSTAHLGAVTLIMLEGWPSWTFSLVDLGFRTISTKLIDVGLSTVCEFNNTYMGESLYSESISEWVNDNINIEIIIFMQYTLMICLK